MKYLLLILSLFLALAVLLYFYARPLWVPVVKQVAGKNTVATVVAAYGETARARLQPYFESVHLNYPPKKLTLLGIKDSAVLELWDESNATPVFIRSYPIQALSGVAGPKLREGDRQVPEGFYNIEGLNPNSAYHLSMKLNYPNAFDLKHATIENRSEPGTNIFIHGKAVSIGCLAMGDTTIEELFVLVADMGKENVRVAIVPSDPRLSLLPVTIKPEWLAELYGQLNSFFMRYQR